MLSYLSEPFLLYLQVSWLLCAILRQYEGLPTGTYETHR